MSQTNRGNLILKDKMMSKTTYLDFARYICDGGALTEVPDKFLDHAMYYLAVVVGTPLKNVPDQFMTAGLCFSSLEIGGDFQDIPSKFRSVGMKYYAVQLGASLMDVGLSEYDHSSYSQHLSDVLEGKKPESVPVEYRDYPLYLTAISRGNIELNQVPVIHRDTEMYHGAVERGATLDCVPDEYITPILCQCALKHGASLDDIPAKLGMSVGELSVELMQEYLADNIYAMISGQPTVPSKLPSDVTKIADEILSHTSVTGSIPQ